MEPGNPRGISGREPRVVLMVSARQKDFAYVPRTEVSVAFSNKRWKVLIRWFRHGLETLLMSHAQVSL